MMIPRVRTSASSDRTPRHPPTSVTATANTPSSSASGGIQQRSATVEVLVLALLRDVDDDLVADPVTRDLLLARRPLEVGVHLVAGVGAFEDDDRTPGSPPVGSNSMTSAWTRVTGGGMLDGGVRSGTSQIATRMMNPPASGSVPPEAGERDRLGGCVAGSLATVGHAGPAVASADVSASSLSARRWLSASSADRLAPETDQDARPAVAGLEPSVVDHSCPAGKGLQRHDQPISNSGATTAIPNAVSGGPPGSRR